MPRITEGRLPASGSVTCGQTTDGDSCRHETPQRPLERPPPGWAMSERQTDVEEAGRAAEKLVLMK